MNIFLILGLKTMTTIFKIMIFFFSPAAITEEVLNPKCRSEKPAWF